MKRIPGWLSLLLLSAVVACSSSIGDAGKGSDPVVTKNTQFAYMNYLYNSEKAKALEAQFLTGDVYAQYPDSVKKELAAILKFPLQSYAPASSSVIGARSASEYSYLPRKDVVGTVVDWYNSFPTEFYDYCKQEGIDIGSAILSDALTKFLDSDKGKAFMTTYLDDIENRLKEVAAYSIDKLESDYETEVNALLIAGGITAASEAVIAGTAVYAALSTTISMTLNPISGIMSGASMAQSYYQHKQMMASLSRISAQLEKVQASLDRIESKLDKLMGYTIDIAVQIKYQNAKNARTQLRVMERQLVYMQGLDTEADKKLVRDYISPANFADDSYQTMMEKAFESAKDTQKWLVDNDLISAPLQKNKTILVKVVENPLKTLVFDNPFVENTISYNDLLMIIKLSKTRLVLAELVYSGNELLRYRKKIAEQDLVNYFESFNNDIEGIIKKYDSQIVSFLNYPFNPSDLYGILTPVSEWDPMYYAGDIESDSAFYYSGLSEVELLPSSSGLNNKFMSYPTNTIESFKVKSTEVLKKFYNEKGKNSFIQLKAMNTAWMMTLQAHIEAGKGL